MKTEMFFFDFYLCVFTRLKKVQSRGTLMGHYCIMALGAV